MDGWFDAHARDRDRLRRITASSEFRDLLRDLVREELAHERRSGLSLDEELARAVAVAVRGSVELILPLTSDEEVDGAGSDAELRAAPYPTFPLDTA